MSNSSHTELSLKPDPKLGPNHFIFRPAGWVARFAKVNVGRSRCGHIEDGICLDLADCETPNGSQWHPGGVISFADLEAIYLAAKALRTDTTTVQP